MIFYVTLISYNIETQLNRIYIVDYEVFDLNYMLIIL